MNMMKKYIFLWTLATASFLDECTFYFLITKLDYWWKNLPFTFISLPSTWGFGEELVFVERWILSLFSQKKINDGGTTVLSLSSDSLVTHTW